MLTVVTFNWFHFARSLKLVYQNQHHTFHTHIQDIQTFNTDKMPVDEMPVDKMTRQQNVTQIESASFIKLRHKNKLD